MNYAEAQRLLEALSVAAEVHTEFSNGQHPSSRILADRAFVSAFVGFVAPDFLVMDSQVQQRFQKVVAKLGLPDPLVPFPGKVH